MKYASTVLLSVFVIFALSESAFSHVRHQHEQSAQPKPSTSELRITKIAETYRKSIQPIFEKKCFDCHGNTTHYPWYYVIPGAKQLINHDVEEAKEHIDFSNGYPFSGHGSLIEDLQAIRETVEKKEMPPFLYRILHPKSALTSSEKDAITQWTNDSEKALRTEAK